MKIISKHKDFYDYLTGIYGVDELAVYDRRSTDFLIHEPLEHNKVCLYHIAICNHKFAIYTYNNKWYHTVDELILLDKTLIENNERAFVCPFYDTSRERYIREYNNNNKTTNINKKLRQPVLGTLYSDKFKPTDDNCKWKIVKLSDFMVPKYIDAETVFKEISAFLLWLNDNPEIPNNQTDTEKILSHGFDIKNSFRKIK